ncbi:MAG TPA: DNA mismatch repair protein MutL, partial [Rheinheimera sp.]|nr:DNA mismatch repair protein MutL [Rheinheimera sp.]
AFIENQYGDVKIWGWLVHPAACSAQLQCQYSYVNGRMMRDKLLNHAIRQAYGEQLLPEQQPAFVLYLELDPRQVDVNVHPAKHEVRFHQARLIHDFVVSALSDALTQLTPPTADVAATVYQVQEATAQPYRQHNGSSRGYTPPAAPAAATVQRDLSYWQHSHRAPVHDDNTAIAPQQPSVPSADSSQLVARNRYLLLQHQQEILVVDLVPTLSAYFAAQRQSAQPLLLPQRIDVSKQQLSFLTSKAEQFSQLGFDMVLTDKVLIVRAVPGWLRQSTISQWLPAWLQQLAQQGADDLAASLLSMLLNANRVSATAVLNSAPQLLSAPQYWVGAPLQLEATLGMLTELNE